MRKLCVILCLLAFSSMALAIDQSALSGFKVGEKEISGNISIMRSSGGDMDMTMLMALGSFGYFVTPNVQIKGSALLFGDKSDYFTMLNGSIGVGADYLFPARMELVPYAGGDLLVSYAKIDMGSSSVDGNDSNSSDVGFGYDIHAGIKQFISENTAINYEIRYMSDSASDSKWLMFMIGFNVYLQ